MFNEDILEKDKDKFINSIFKNYKSSEEFTYDDYSRLKLLTQISKLEELRDVEKMTKYKDIIINDDEKPRFNFLREEAKYLNSDYIPKTNYGYKNRNKKFSTVFKKHLNLNLFTENVKKKIKIEDNFPNDFDDINEQIELKEIENISEMDKYLINEKINILNQEEYWNNSKNIKSTRALTSKNPKSLYAKSFTEPNLNNNKIKSKRISDTQRVIKSARRDINNIFPKNKNKNLINLKLSNKNTFSRNSTNINNINNNLSNYTTTFKSFSMSQSKKNKLKNTFKKIEEKVLNRDSFFITRNNNNPQHYNNKKNKTEFKSSKQLINRVINDGFVIDKYIRTNRLKTRKTQEKKDKESILLKLLERLKTKNDKKNKKRYKKFDLTDEEVFIKKLSLVPGFAKKFFRSIYNRILFENRILNKNEVVYMKSLFEKYYGKKRLNNELKKATLQRMRITKDNLVTEKDDKILLEEQKKAFDYYGNLDGLEWLITKRNILTYGRKYH